MALVLARYAADFTAGSTLDAWCTPIDKLMFWRGGNWMKYDSKSLLKLRVHCDQLFLIDGNKLVETLNMNGKLRGIYKSEVLILVLNAGHEIRKIKFQLKENFNHYYMLLNQHFPVTSHKNSTKSGYAGSYVNIGEIFRKVVHANDNNALKIQTPPNYEDFVKLCLLDPTFPNTVVETQKIIQSLINNKQ